MLYIYSICCNSEKKKKVRPRIARFKLRITRYSKKNKFINVRFKLGVARYSKNKNSEL